MSLSWANPPPVVLVGGTEEFLVRRELKNAILSAHKSGIRTEFATSDSEAVDILTGAATFGDTCLVHIDAKEVSEQTVQEVLENPVEKVCLLIHCPYEVNPKKFPFIKLLHGAYIREHKRPEKRAGVEKLALRFIMFECGNILGNKTAISEGLAKAIVRVVGTDLGVLSFECLKFCMLAKSQNRNTIEKDDVVSLLKQGDSLDLDSMRQALKNKDVKGLALSLFRIRKKSTSDPSMLLLRGRGGPADLAFNWLLVKKLQKARKSLAEISSRSGISEWILKKDYVPTLKNWEEKKIEKLLFDLSECDRGILLGCPSPWTACETVLLRSVLQ